MKQTNKNKKLKNKKNQSQNLKDPIQPHMQQISAEVVVAK